MQQCYSSLSFSFPLALYICPISCLKLYVGKPHLQALPWKPTGGVACPAGSAPVNLGCCPRGTCYSPATSDIVLRSSRSARAQTTFTSYYRFINYV